MSNVIRCLSKSASYVGDKSNPLFTSNLSWSLAFDHGTICEAIRISNLLKLVTAHLYSHLCMILYLYAPCPTLDVTNPERSVTVGRFNSNILCGS